MMNSVAWGNGYRSFWSGVSIDNCPFHEGTQDHRDWVAGWNEGKADSEEEEEHG